MEDYNFKFLCLVQDSVHLNLTFDKLNTTFVDSVFGDDTISVKHGSPAGFGTFTGVCVALLINALFTLDINKLENQRLNVKLSELISIKTLLRIVALVILVLVSPIIIIVLLAALLYKLLCSIIIKAKDERFVGYLDSFDVFWSLEDDSSKSIINVLGVIESDSAYDLVKNIKDKLEHILPSKATDKIFYRRKEQFGFYYWRESRDIDMGQYVQIVDHACKEEISMRDLQNIMSEVSGQALPYSDEGLFQILITKQRLEKRDDDKGEYGIIFRIHHAVGDGVALIEFLCKTLADENDSCLKIFSNSESGINYSSPADLRSMMRKLCEMPLCFVDGILRQSDDNSLHGPVLSGKKVFAWNESDDSLLDSVKEIKNSVEDWRFSDILATALAQGLQDFFAKNVAVVLPVRFPKATTDEADFKLENDFSVTILDLPIKEHSNVDNIKRQCDELRRSADPLTNYLFLKLVAGVLPKQMLQPLLNSSQATMVFSNMPGPGQLRLCNGNLLKSLVFFVPHKGTTGLGITALCYGGVLRFAAMTDAALVSSSEENPSFLEEWWRRWPVFMICMSNRWWCRFGDVMASQLKIWRQLTIAESKWTHYIDRSLKICKEVFDF